MRIEDDALHAPDVRDLARAHLAELRTITPPESTHALDLGGLSAPGVRVWAAREDDGTLLGMVAVQALDATHLELKSMRTVADRTGSGVGAALLRHVLDVARADGVQRISLETGSEDFFAPARRLYLRHGFVPCSPFASYRPDPLSAFLMLDLREA